MGRNRRKPLYIEKVNIVDTSSKGKSIAKDNGKVIFVEGGVPGDICDITVFKKRKQFSEARIEKFHKYSERRSVPKCEHFGVCGGCKWQNMEYKSQLDFKEKGVLNNLKRIGGLNLPKHANILASKNEYFYRNKMEFTFSNKRWLTLEEIQSKKTITNKDACGFHIPGMYDKVIDINNCYLQKDPSNDIRLSIKKFANENNLTYFDIKNHTGLLRNLIIRTSSTNDLMVLIQFYEDNKENRDLLMDHIKNSFPSITSLMYVINQKANSTIYDLDIVCYHGKDHITEEIDGLYFKIGAKSFFQTNSYQAKILYRKTKQLAKIRKDDIVYDLYTGTGTIAQYVSDAAKKVIGIDSVDEGIKAADKNADKNNITNCTFYTGDIKEIFTDDFVSKNGSPNIIITDPPRDGMHKKVVDQILKISPKRIIYISCNSATQARDLSIMEKDYKITHIQPIDMFPQTHHVENVVVLELKD